MHEVCIGGPKKSYAVHRTKPFNFEFKNWPTGRLLVVHNVYS